MKFNKIIAICKKHGKFTIVTKHNVNGEAEYQLLGDGLAVYPLYGHPIYNEEYLTSVADLSNKKADETMFIYENITDENTLYSDCTAEDEVCNLSTVSLCINGVTYVPVLFRNEIDFINAYYLTPIYDDDIEVYWRAEQPNGNNVFAVKTGLNLSALILGSKSLIPDTMVNELAKILLALRKESEGK